MDQQVIEKIQHRDAKIIPELRHYKTLFILGTLTEVISTITCSQMAKRRNDISVPADSSVAI